MPGGIETIANGRRGIIACITLDLATDGRSWWNKIGFASRLLPFAFSHSGSLTLKIKSMIDAGSAKADPPKRELRVPNSLMAVKFDDKYVRKVREMADAKAKELDDPTGYRRLKQFRALACGHALRRTFKRVAVNQEDIDFLDRVYKYISYTKLNPL
jgi:hypothetical protein